MSEDLASFTIEAMVRGHHVYRDVWHATKAEQLPCQREIGNVADPFAVAIVKSGAIVQGGYHQFARSSYEEMDQLCVV